MWLNSACAGSLSDTAYGRKSVELNGFQVLGSKELDIAVKRFEKAARRTVEC